MTKKEIKKAIKNIEDSIKNITNKKNKLLFFVADSKGTPIGSLTYTYTLAYRLKQLGYDVRMLYAEKEFVGVGGWLGAEYASLPHYNATQDILDVSPADVLFIPELYSSVMNTTKSLHCKKIAILYSFNYMTELIPYGESWRTLGVTECITTSEGMKTRLKEVFPEIRTHVIRPVIEDYFRTDEEIVPELVVNIITRDSKEIPKIVKPFKWKFPGYGFVTFRHLNGLTRNDLATLLSTSQITIWVDTETDFGYTALEAMACGNVVIGKLPENIPDWMMNPEDGKIIDNGVWYYNNRQLPDILAGVIKAVLHEEIPTELKENVDKTIANFTQEMGDKDIDNVINKTIMEDRKKELSIIKETLNNQLTKKES